MDIYLIILKKSLQSKNCSLFSNHNKVLVFSFSFINSYVS